jgi:hypothetical protein
MSDHNSKVEHYHLRVQFMPSGKSKDLFAMYKYDDVKNNEFAGTVGHIRQQIVDYYGDDQLFDKIKLFWLDEELVNDAQLIKDVCIRGREFEPYVPNIDDPIFVYLVSSK